MAQTAQQFWDDLPQITKYLCVFILGLTMIAQFGLVSGYSLILDFDLIFNLKQLQLWRLITGVFFYGGFSFSFLMNFLVFLQYSSKLEKDTFGGRSADYVFMLLFGSFFMLIAAYFLSMPIVSYTLLMYIIYVWCNLNTNAHLSLFMIPFQIPARYFPWAFMMFHVLLGGSIVSDLIGIVIGHAYYFVMFYYPREYHKTLISTPGFLLNWFPPQRMSVHGLNQSSSQPAPQRAQQTMGPHRWGDGRRLGAE